jgi:hypothetical protein
MKMSDELLLLIINLIVIPLLVEAYKLILNYWKSFKPTKLHISIVLTVVAFGLSLFVGKDYFAGLPPIGDNFMAWLAVLVESLGTLVGATVLIYNILWDKFFDAIGKRFTLFAYRKPA